MTHLYRRTLVPVLVMPELWLGMLLPAIPFAFLYASIPEALRSGAGGMMAREYGSWVCMSATGGSAVLAYLKMFQDWGAIEEHDIASGIGFRRIHVALSAAATTVAGLQCLIVLAITGSVALMVGSDLYSIVRWSIANLCFVPVCWCYLQVAGITLRFVRQPFIAMMVVIGCSSMSLHLSVAIGALSPLWFGSVLAILGQIFVPDVEWFVKLLKIANYAGPEVGSSHWLWFLGSTLLQGLTLTLIFLGIKPTKRFLEKRLSVRRTE